jgi:hypothetical protein
VAHPRLLKREHCRIVQSNGQTAALNMLYPYPQPKHAPLASGVAVGAGRQGVPTTTSA